MKTNNNNIAVSAAAPVVIPVEFSPLKGMNDLTLATAANVAAKNPNIVKAAVEFREAYSRAGEKFFGIASALRDAKLVKKEATMLMHALGFSASRTSEMIRLSSVSDEIWAKYNAQTIGFRAALQLEAGADGEGEGEDGEGDNSTGGKKTRAKIKIHAFPKAMQTLLNEVAKGMPKANKGGKRTEYGFNAQDQDGVTYYFSLFADKAE